MPAVHVHRLITPGVSGIFLVSDLHVTVTRTDVLLKLMFSRECVIVGEPQRCYQLERGMVPLLVWTQVSITHGYFVALQLIRGCALGPLDSSALGDKTSSPKGNWSKANVNFPGQLSHLLPLSDYGCFTCGIFPVPNFLSFFSAAKKFRGFFA